MTTPLELLESELRKWVKAKKKSTEAYNANQIPWELHEEHVKNLNPLIEEWTKAVDLFKRALAQGDTKNIKTAEEIFNLMFDGLNGEEGCYHFPELKKWVLFCMNEFHNQQTK